MLFLNVLKIKNTVIAGSLCEGETYYFNDQEVATESRNKSTLKEYKGFDSVISLEIITTTISKGKGPLPELGAMEYQNIKKGQTISISANTSKCESIIGRDKEKIKLKYADCPVITQKPVKLLSIQCSQQRNWFVKK